MRLLVGVAAATLSGVVGASAEDVNWINSNPVESRWESAGNWSSAALPAPGDIVTIGTGNSGLYTDVTVGTVNLGSGVLWVNRNGVLNAGTVNVTGGELALSKGNTKAPTNPGPQGLVNISTLLNIAGGTVDRFGLIDLGATGTVTQSGGLVDAVQIKTPSYDQTGGTMNGMVTTSNYTFSDDAVVAGTIVGGGDAAAVTQSGGAMTGTATGVASYTQTAGSLTGTVRTGTFAASGGSSDGYVEFSDLLDVSGDAAIGWVHMVGNADAIATQTGGTMGGIVYAGELGTGTGIASYSQSGGDMTGWVTTGVYQASGGSVSSSVDFSELFALSGDAVIAGGVQIVGDGDAAMTQTGGTMGGDASGIATYDMSGGTITGTVNFGDHFELSGTGRIEYVDIVGDAEASMTQTGGSMGGAVYSSADDWTIGKYTQTGGSMNAEVYARTYDVSGGSVDGMVRFSELFALSGDAVVGNHYIWGDGTAIATQSGGTMGGEVSDVTNYVQSGGAMTGSVATEDYALSGGTVSGPVHFGGTFALSADGEVMPAAALYGDWSAQMTQSGGSMGGLVTGIASYTQSGGTMGGSAVGVTTYTQSGGTMSGAASTASYALTGGTVSGQASFGTQFTLAGTGEVSSAATLIGDGSATITQAAGTMGGTVTGVTSYTQSGGVMGGTATAQTYALSAGTLSGTANFGTSFALSGTGDVSSTGKVVGDGSATMAQAGGTMNGTVGGITGYTQSAGAMGGKVAATTYTMSGGTLSGEATGFTNFLLSGNQSTIVSGTLVGASGSTVTQSGGKMNGNVTGIANYIQQERVGSAAVIGFSQNYQLVDGQVDVGARIVGGVGSVMTQSGPGKMQGDVSGVTTYAQRAGTMNGSVSAGSYALSSGTLSGTANFSSDFTLGSAGAPLSGQINGSALLHGGVGSTMTQLGGSMKGTVNGVASYSQTAGDMGGIQANTNLVIGKVGTGTYALSGGTVAGQVDFSSLFTLSGTGVVMSTAQLAGGSGSTMTQTASTMGGTVTGVGSYSQSGGTMNGSAAAANYVQSGGTMSGAVTAPSYALSGGTLSGTANFATMFTLSGTGSVASTALLTGGAGATMLQSAGSMSGTVTGIDSYTQSGGSMTGNVTAVDYNHVGGSASGALAVANYNLGGASATWDGTLTASNAFNLGFDDGTATLDARLSGTADLIKTGTSTIVLTNGANDFSGDVAVNGGVLEIRDAAMPGQANVTVANTATLRFNTAAGISTVFDGNMSGATGLLEKTGLGALTLSGDINLGGLQVNAGLLNIGNGAPEEASFDSAYIGLGATVYVASGATLRIRIPKNIVNFGTLTNDGTVYDDLDNAGMFVNNAVYVANVASNTRDIANNAPGVWTGDVLTNNGWINNNENATWNGNVVTNAALGTNGQPGRIANAGGTWRGNILSNAGHIINDNRADEIGTGYWIGDIYSNTNWIFNGGGGDWTGDVITNAGVVMNGKPAVWHGDVRSNSNLVWNGGVWNGRVLGNAGTFHNAGGTWNGNVEANAGLIQNIAGTDAHGSTGGSTWIGNVVTNGGTILNAADSTWTGNVLSNSGTINTLGLWAGNITNAGTLKAQNRIVGSVANSGTLRVTGNLAGITTLTNSGTIDMTGGGSQVLSAASASFGSGSFLNVQIDPNGLADRIAVTGTASLGGTVRVSNGGTPHTNGPFTIISAGSISGTFDAVTTDLAFLSPRLSYDAQSVRVAIQRNDLGFGTLGATGNQMATGAAVEALGPGNALYDAVLWLTQAEAQSAFSQVSGEPHASQVSGAVESANTIGEMAGDRVAQAFAALGEGDTQASGYAESLTPMTASKPRTSAVWGQFYGARGVVDAANGTAGVVSSAGGVVLGIDGLLADWRLGMMLQGGLSGAQVSALNASANSTDYGVGLYGGRQFGATEISFGATYTRHLNSTMRQVSFPGYSDLLSGSYGSGTAQVFANVSQAFDFGAVSLKPYAGLAYVSHATDGFTETGGAAALSSTANLINATFASLGLGVEQQFVVGNDMLLTASGSIGWRHAFAEVPLSVHQFGAGPSFAVAGKPIASDLLTLGAGLALDVGGGTNLNLTYTGQMGGGTQTHGLQGTWAKQF